MPIAQPCKLKKCNHTVEYNIHMIASEYNHWVDAQKTGEEDGVVECPHCEKQIPRRRTQTEFQCIHQHQINVCTEYPLVYLTHS